MGGAGCMWPFAGGVDCIDMFCIWAGKVLCCCGIPGGIGLIGCSGRIDWGIDCR